MTRARRLAASLSLAGAALAAPTVATAGGLARPNVISAHGVAMGGAFVAIADDPTALHYDPAGLAFADPSVHLGGELVIAPRSYTPVDAAGTRGAEQAPHTPIVPVPAIGVTGRVNDRVVLGAGAWNSYGGKLKYDKTGMTAIDESQEAVFEVVAGGAFRVTPRFAVGAALRVGIGLFDVVATNKPVTSDLSGVGVGLGATLGVTWKPGETVTVGGVWRSELSVDVAGSGGLEIPGQGTLDVDLKHNQPWPQSASLGVALAASPSVTVSGQVDWTQWSRWERLEISFTGHESANQSFLLDWQDNYAVRAGLEWRSSPRFALRAGLYFDSNAVPDLTIERQYLDANKFGGALGTRIGLGTWRVDLAGDFSGGPARTVPDNSAEVGDFRGLQNIAPGEHKGTVLTLELAASRSL